jgi:hypothetical protein
MMTTKVQMDAWVADMPTAATVMVVSVMTVVVRAVSVPGAAAMGCHAPAIDRITTSAISHDAALAINRIPAGTAAMRMTATGAMTMIMSLRSRRDKEDKACSQQQEWNELFHGRGDLAFDSLPAVSGVHV